MPNKRTLIELIKQYEPDFSLDRAAYIDTNLRESMRTQYSHLINILHNVLFGYFFIRQNLTDKYTELIISHRYVDNRLIRLLEQALDIFSYRMFTQDPGALHVIIPEQRGFNLREFLINYKKVDMIPTVRDIIHPTVMVGTMMNDRGNLLEITRWFDCQSIVQSIDMLDNFTEEEGLGSYDKVSGEFLTEYLNRAKSISQLKEEVSRGIGLNNNWYKLYVDHLSGINASLGYHLNELRIAFKNEADIPDLVMALNGFIGRQIDRHGNNISIPMTTEEAMDVLGTINKVKRLSDDRDYTLPRFLR